MATYCISRVLCCCMRGWLQTLRWIRRHLLRQWSAYQLVAAIIDRLKSTQKLSPRTQQLLTSLERSTSGTGIYLILCQLNKMILSLYQLASKAAGAKSLCIDHSKSVERTMSRLERFSGPRFQAAYSAAVLSVSMRKLLRRSEIDVDSLLRRTMTSRFNSLITH